MLNCHPMVSFGDLWGHVITLRGQILVSGTDGDYYFFSFVFVLFCVCVWCVGRRRRRGRVDSKRPRVCRHHAHTLVTRVCGAGTHGVESTHGGFFSVSRHTPRSHHCHNDAQPQPHTHDNDNDTQPTKQQHQPTNLRLNSIQHEKTHQVKTRQGLTD